ncbi:MAG: hypothetical protein IIY57_05890 [Erysipelotrichaceae bacterium]|nr:hypothetical protein [Erysipelotrichaceae bacterium]
MDCLKAIDELKKEGYSSVEIYNNEDFGAFYIDNAEKYVDALGDDAVCDILYGLLEDEMDKDFHEDKLTPKEDEWYAKHVLVDALSKMAVHEDTVAKLYLRLSKVISNLNQKI